MANAKKNSLVENINRRKRAGTSRPKKKTTVSKKSYADMQAGWPRKSAKKKKAPARAKKTARHANEKQDPEGGLTAKGRAYFKQKEGAKLKPGVKGPADTPEKMRRKGSFLRRHYAHPRGPMKDEKGNPTRLALAAHAWGEPVPKTMADARKLAAKGTRLLERYKRSR